MVFTHDFEKFPELTNSQMQVYYWTSPHKQITEDFRARVVKVKDGDTIQLNVEFRDFDFPLRLLDIDAPELNEGGQEAKSWLENEIEGEEVEIKMGKQRVGKFGRLLGRVLFRGMDMGQTMQHLMLVTSFKQKGEGKIPDVNRTVRKF